MKSNPRLISGCLLLAALVGGSSCVTEPSALTGERQNYGYTWEQELDLGKRSDADLIREMGLYPDDALAAYVTEIGERVLAQSNLRQPDAPEMYRDLRFSFRVMDSPVVNAFALPGGYVYVTRGLLAHLNNEAQLAVVLGHEITHVAARHASRQAYKQQLGQIGLIAGAVIGQGVTGQEGFAEQFLDIGGSVFQLVSLKYGRDAERESDFFGVECAAKAGYSVGEAAAFFNSLGRLSDGSGSRLPAWQSSHPDPGERESRMLLYDLEMRQKYGDLRIGEKEYLKRIEGIVVGENPRQGMVKGGVFYHPDMDFQFELPKGWKARNEASSVTLVEPNGRALLLFRLASEKTPKDAALRFAADSKIRILHSGEIGGGEAPGYVIEGSLATSGGTLLVRNAFVVRNKQVFSFLGYANAGLAPAFRPQFEAVSSSFGPIRDKAMRDVQPIRLSARPVEKEGSFSSLLPKNLPKGMGPAEMAILNQVQLEDAIPKGRALKLLEP